MAQANAVRLVQNWQRKPWNHTTADSSGATLIRVEMSHLYEGDITGEGHVQYLIATNGDGRGSFVALEKVVGSLGGRQGSFVFQHTGTFDRGWIRQSSAVVPGSGSGDLSSLSGQATYNGEQHRYRFPVLLEYQLS